MCARLKILTIGFISFITTTSCAQNWFFNTADIQQDSLPLKNYLQFHYQFGDVADTKTEGVQYIDSNPFQSFNFRFGVYGYGMKK